MDFHSGLGGVERRGADLLETGGGGPEQDDPSLQPRRVRGPLEDRGGGQVGKGPVRSAKVHQQVAVTVEGDPPPVKTQRLDPVRSRFEDGVASASAQVKGQGEVRVERPLVADHQGNAAQDSVRVGGDVEKAGGTGRLRQDGQVADDPPGVEEAVGASRSSAGENRRAKRVEDTRVPPRRFEVELVAEDEGTTGERRREGPVGVQRFLRKAREVDPRPEVAQDLPGEGRERRPVGFGEHHVEPDRRRAGRANPFEEAGDPVPRPWPLAEAFETRLVEIHDRDRAGRRVSRGGPEKRVVDLPLDGIGQRRGPGGEGPSEEGEDDARKDRRKGGVAGRASHRSGYRTVISTRRFRGSGTWSPVGTRGLSFPWDVMSRTEGSTPFP